MQNLVDMCMHFVCKPWNVVRSQSTTYIRASEHILARDAGSGTGASRLSSRPEGVAGVFATAQVRGLTASVCSLADHASYVRVKEDTWRL
jgi:hypothetical protein